MTRLTILKTTAYAIAAVQLALGLAYLLVPAQFDKLLGLSGAPDWTSWPLQMAGARFLAFGFGMLLVARRPLAHLSWIQAMILVQALDWLATVANLARGTVTLTQVGTASFLPLLFIVGLVAGYPRAHTQRQMVVRAAADANA